MRNNRTKKSPCEECLVKMTCLKRLTPKNRKILVVEKLKECPFAKDYIYDENNPHSPYHRDFRQRIKEINKAFNLDENSGFLWRA